MQILKETGFLRISKTFLGYATSMPPSFWTAFWPSLGAGLIYSTFTGAIVGIFVILVEYRMEKRRLLHEYGAQFTICVERLRVALSRPDVIQLEGPAESFPVHAELAMTIIREYPIASWREYLYQSHKKIFKSTLRFMQAYTAFSLAAGELGNCLHTAVRKYNAMHTFEASRDMGLIRFFTGNALGLPYEEILPWIPAADPHELREGFLALSYNIELTPLVVPYKETRKELQDSAAALWKSIEDTFLKASRG